MFLRTGVLKICSEFKGEHPCSDFNKVALQRYLQVNIGLALRPHWVLEAMLFYANLSFKKLFHFFFSSSLFILFFFPYFSRSMKGRYIHFLPSFYINIYRESGRFVNMSTEWIYLLPFASTFSALF